MLPIRYSYQSVQCFHVSKQWCVLPVLEIFNVGTNADACDCTWGLYGHRERVCTESWLWEKNSLPHLSVFWVGQLSYPAPQSWNLINSMPLIELLFLECCFTSTETVGLLGTGAQDVHLNFHTAPELCINWLKVEPYELLQSSGQYRLPLWKVWKIIHQHVFSETVSK